MCSVEVVRERKLATSSLPLSLAKNWYRINGFALSNICFFFFLCGFLNVTLRLFLIGMTLKLMFIFSSKLFVLVIFSFLKCEMGFVRNQLEVAEIFIFLSLPFGDKHIVLVTCL